MNGEYSNINGEIARWVFHTAILTINVAALAHGSAAFSHSMGWVTFAFSSMGQSLHWWL